MNTYTQLISLMIIYLVLVCAINADENCVEVYGDCNNGVPCCPPLTCSPNGGDESNYKCFFG